MKGVIYCYHCISTGKKYIGQTVHEERRKRQHKHDCKRGVDNKFYRAVRKYGWNKFIYGIVEEYDVDLLAEQEIYYIDCYDSYNNGYNSTIGGEGVGGCSPSEETRKKMSESAKNRSNPPHNKKYFTEEEKREAKREAKRERDRKYQQKIKERRKEYMKEWREKNKDKIEKWKENNKEHLKQLWKKRREKRKYHTEEEKQKCRDYHKQYYHNVVKPLKQVAQQNRKDKN
jgi:group I intron endonuclease